MPRQLPIEIRRYYSATRVTKKHELGPGWMLKCDTCGERSHVAFPPKGSDYNVDLIQHLLEHAASHAPAAPTSSPTLAPRTPPKLRVVHSMPKPVVIPPIPIGVIPSPFPSPSTGYYRVIREGKYTKVMPVPHTEYQGGTVQAVGGSHTVVVQAVNSKHAQAIADGLIDRHIRPPRPTRSWRNKLYT